MSKYKKLDFKNVKTYSITSRKSKVSFTHFAKPCEKDQNMERFIENCRTY